MVVRDFPLTTSSMYSSQQIVNQNQSSKTPNAHTRTKPVDVDMYSWAIPTTQTGDYSLN